MGSIYGLWRDIYSEYSRTNGLCYRKKQKDRFKEEECKKKKFPVRDLRYKKVRVVYHGFRSHNIGVQTRPRVSTIDLVDSPCVYGLG